MSTNVHDLHRAETRKRRSTPHFHTAHPLAEVAARHCAQHIGHRGVGRVACGVCWERAIRDDEKFVVETGLPRAIDVDADYIDDIAFEKACRGERIDLTPADLVAVVAILRRRRLSVTQIATRLHVSNATVHNTGGAMPAGRAAA